MRKTTLPIGTKIGLFGDYNAPSAWGENLILKGKITKFVVVERSDQILPNGETLDLSIIATREKNIPIPGIDSLFIGKNLLILHRYPDGDWDYSDPNVQVLGIDDVVDIDSIQETSTWHQYSTWLSSAAIFAVIDETRLSEMGTILKDYDYV